MGSKSITISDDAYEYLKAMKRENESFTEVILSFKARKEGLMKYWGIAKDEDFSSVEATREEFNNNFEQRSKEIWK